MIVNSLISSHGKFGLFFSSVLIGLSALGAMTCMDSFLAWYWIFMSSVQSSMIWAASRYSIVSMHNCQRIDWISKNELFRHHLLHSCKYHNNFYVLQFLQQEFQMDFFFILRSLQTSTTCMIQSCIFFPFQIKIAIGSEYPNGSLESHFPII